MKWIVLPALLAGVVAFVSPAQSQSIGGCWHYSDGANVFSSVCFNGSDGGTFNLEYAVEDPEQGIVKGSCNGVIEVGARSETEVAFTVPVQEEACRQEDQVFRMAQRDYSCVLDGARLLCDLTVYYDDGTVFSEATGLEYAR
jgi:hypothetical protein